MSIAGIGPGGGPGDVLAALRDGRIQGDDARLKAATRLLEGSFYEQLFKAMRETVPEGGAISRGEGEDIFEGLMDQRIAESAAMRAEGGLGEALYRYFAGYDAPAAGVDATASGAAGAASGTGDLSTGVEAPGQD
jgi:flagellar protein FlgJ